MLATMMDRPLLISSLLWRAENVFADRVSVTCEHGCADTEFTYRNLGLAARRLAGALDELGVGFGTRVATLAWNTFRHLAAYYAVPGIGAVLHTVNHRMSADQIVARVTPRAAVINQARAMWSWHGASRIGRISVPTTVVHGNRDPLIPVGNGMRLARVIPDANYVELPGVGHLVPQEAGNDLLRVLEN